MEFSNKVVLVTGASSGIGAAIALKFCEQGANVVLAARNENKLKTLAEKCEENGVKPLTIIADVTKDHDVKNVINATINQFQRLDVLVNNAGIVSHAKITDDNAMEVFDHIMATNLRSAVYMTHVAAPHLIESRGNVINISSVVTTAVFIPGHFGYCTSKAGLDHFTRAVALDLAPNGVRVNTVNPGPVYTDILHNTGIPKPVEDKMWENFATSTALGRVSEPVEIADLVLFLASDKAKAITGSNYIIDNGALLKRNS